MLEVLDYSTTGAWRSPRRSAAPAVPEFEAHLAHLAGVAVVAAAWCAGCPATGTLRRPPALLGLPGLGVLRCPSGRARVGDRDGRLRVVEDAEAGAPSTSRDAGPPAQDGARGRTGHGYGWSALRACRAVRPSSTPRPLPGAAPRHRAHGGSRGQTVRTSDHPAWAGR